MNGMMALLLVLIPAAPEENAGNRWLLTRTIPAPEAVQAAAADAANLYAIHNTGVARYDRSSGLRTAVSRGEAQHLNSGFLWNGRLYCAHSNYPRTPELSEIKVLDLGSLELTTYHDFGDFGGSLTWVVRHENHWWCNFARYGRENGQTFLVEFDDAWKERRRWTYPESVVQRLGNYSLSGGLWRDGYLWVTGHDDPLVFRLKLPSEGTVLVDAGTQAAPFTGQGIAHDPLTGGLIGIHRARKELVLARPAIPVLLRVLTYNIHHGEGIDGRLDLDRLATVMRSVEPDLVAVQEVDQNVPRSGTVDQPAEFARKLQFHFAFGGNLELNGGQYGNLLLSRYPILRHENRVLPRPNSGEPRGLLIGDVAIPGRFRDKVHPVRILVTHFDHRNDPRERLESVARIRSWTADSPGPCVLAGDLNDVPGSAVLKDLERDWTRAGDLPLPTFPVRNPNQQIDHVLVRPAARWTVREARVLENDVASDHRAFLTVLELLDPESDSQPAP